MNDIVERLRARAKSLRGMGSIAHVDADTDDEAAAEITRLRAENERLWAALESAEAWLDRWAVHVGRCEGGHRCTCGLTAIRYDVSAALEEAPQGRISEAAAQPAPSGWRPIETAPKDGTRIILFTTTSGDAELTQYLRDVGDECETLEAVQIGSFNEVSGEWDLQHFIGNPTHWMPLPPAPGKEEA